MFAGIPAIDAGPERVQRLTLEMESPLAGVLPDVDEMREVYRAARSFARRPAHAPNLEALAQLLAEEAHISATKCHVSLLALADMRLVELRGKPFGLVLPPMRKTDPDSSAVWRRIQTLKRGIEGRELR